jgi:hypothetical protein
LNVTKSRVLFSLPLSTLKELRAYQAKRGPDPVADTFDAFILDPGLGAPTYITSDGCVLWEDIGDWGPSPLTLRDAFFSILAGVEKTGIVSLRQVLPSQPSNSWPCVTCGGSGRIPFGNVRLLCGTCGGLGWCSPDINLDSPV